ncbi:hypothetical protein [Henriciella sp.]|uniref:hypothetical protein n=1 Tax=Henriciella sp. TaxID=1968823 RepID=UPI002631D1E9|nr:hypothetical protein [Henriciella sp.]
MNEPKKANHRQSTLDEKAKPRTTPSTDEQIEDQKAFRESSAYPPAPPENDDTVEDAVRRKSWDTLKP